MHEGSPHKLAVLTGDKLRFPDQPQQIRRPNLEAFVSITA